MAIDIRPLRESDLPAALRLKSLARWNQTEDDWKRLIELEPNGCFCATSKDVVVATTTTTTYGTDLAWIGMVLVDPDYQRRGIATELMNVALEYLNKLGVSSIKLDATSAGYPVYERLGFKEESLVERWEGIASQLSDARQGANCDGREQLHNLDRRAFGSDRSILIDMLCRKSVVDPEFVTDDRRQLSGYALARQGSLATYLGPIVADDESSAVRLCDAVLNQLAGRQIYIDLNTKFADARRIFSERGFAKQRDLIRMGYGNRSDAASSSSILAIAGPELG
jgi:ribosomal protein S18 acetylase RimI-like enzyme